MRYKTSAWITIDQAATDYSHGIRPYAPKALAHAKRIMSPSLFDSCHNGHGIAISWAIHLKFPLCGPLTANRVDVEALIGMKTISKPHLPVAQDDSSDCDSHHFTSRPFFEGARIRTGIFIVTFALSMALNIYTITVGRVSTGAQESVAKTVQLSSELTPFGTFLWCPRRGLS